MSDSFSELGFSLEAPAEGVDELGFVAEETPTPSFGKRVGRGALAALHGLSEAGSALLGGTGRLKPGPAPFFQPESGLEKGISRAVEGAFTTAALGGGGKLAGLAATGGFLGQATEEAGGGPVAQFVAEILPVAAAPLAAGKLFPSKANRPLVEGARRLGMTEKEIAPLVRGKRADRLANSVVAKPEARKKIVARSRGGIEKALSAADEQVSKIGPVSQDLRTGMIDYFEDLAHKVEGGIGELAGNREAAVFLRRNLKNMGRKELTGKDLKKLYRAINEKPSLRGSEAGRLAKDKIVETIRAASPEAAEDFSLANDLYRRFKLIEGGPRHMGERLDRIELYGLATGIATGNAPSAVKKYAAIEGLRTAFTKVVSGPRGHRLVQKMTQAMAEGKPAVAQAAAKRLLEDTKKVQQRSESAKS